MAGRLAEGMTVPVTRVEYGRRHDRDACGCDVDMPLVEPWGPTIVDPPPVVSWVFGHYWVRVQRTVTVGEWETTA